MAETNPVLSADAVDALAARLRGTVERPGAPGYEAARTVWNAMIDRRPSAAARRLGVAVVQACIGFAREAGVPLAIKGGGHNIAGLAVCDGGLVLDMSAMRGVWVDREMEIARAQAGCLLGDVDQETQLHGLAAVLGFVSTTAVAGRARRGGLGGRRRGRGARSGGGRGGGGGAGGRGGGPGGGWGGGGGGGGARAGWRGGEPGAVWAPRRGQW